MRIVAALPVVVAAGVPCVAPQLLVALLAKLLLAGLLAGLASCKSRWPAAQLPRGGLGPRRQWPQPSRQPRRELYQSVQQQPKTANENQQSCYLPLRRVVLVQAHRQEARSLPEKAHYD